MKNIITYVKKFGHLTFEEFPFNEVDSLILCQVSYLKFDDLVPTLLDEDKKGVTLKVVNDPGKLLDITVHYLSPKKNQKLVRALLESKRFAKMRLNFYRSQISSEEVKQFCAVTFLFKKFAYVAFRGTDSTLIGWKEDFHIAIKDRIPSQKEACEYLTKVASKTSLPLYVGGHSKGGNLAYYATINVSKKIQDRLVSIYNFDGPGFYENVEDSPSYLRVKDKMIKTIPQDDLVGILMYHVGCQTVVKCRSVSILQHDPYNWKITKEGRFKRVKDTYGHVKVMDMAVKKMVFELSEEERIKFIDTLFDVMGVNANITVVDITKHPYKYLKYLRSNFKKLTKEQREPFLLMRKCYLKAWKESYKTYKKDKKSFRELAPAKV